MFEASTAGPGTLVSVDICAANSNPQMGMLRAWKTEKPFAISGGPCHTGGRIGVLRVRHCVKKFIVMYAGWDELTTWRATRLY
jgi:hypothetical protein